MKCELCKSRITDNNYGATVKDRFGMFVCWACLHNIPWKYRTSKGIDLTAYQLGGVRQ